MSKEGLTLRLSLAFSRSRIVGQLKIEMFNGLIKMCISYIIIKINYEL